MKVELSRDQVGKAGELLVQFKLLKFGIESARLTTDCGVDLVAYHKAGQRPMTIQVKTANPRGRKQRRAVFYQVSRSCPAHYMALVDLEQERVWLMDYASFMQRAQQQRSNECALWFYVDDCGVSERAAVGGLEIDEAIPRIFAI